MNERTNELMMIEWHLALRRLRRPIDDLVEATRVFN